MEPTVTISQDDAWAILCARAIDPDVARRLLLAVWDSLDGPDSASTAFRPEGCTCGGHTTAPYVVHFTDRPCYVVPDTHSECRSYATELRNRAQVHG